MKPDPNTVHARNEQVAEIPRGDLAGFRRYFRQDFTSGLLVFLIALPLCLGISLASGYPAIAGVFTAIIGAILTTFISNSELTIKGPAAGLIVIVIGAVESFGGDGTIGGFTAADEAAYRMVLAVTATAALLQIAFGLFRAGILAEMFPLAAVHGMLAAIGVIIMLKQIPVALGVTAKGSPLAMLLSIPEYFRSMNPRIALIGAVGVALMFLWPLVQKRIPALKKVPAALLVLMVTVPLGFYFDLQHEHSYKFGGQEYPLGESFLVSMPDRVFGMFDSIRTPAFSILTDPSKAANAWKWVAMFFIIGSLESLLSSKAVELLDPWKRKTDMNRDILAVGIANFCASMVGGLPMISEIVRSRANIDNGGRTRFADMWHGVFLLVCVALIPMVLHQIPLAALASMLIYTGFRLAHPREFWHVWRIGKEQLLVFVGTLVGVLATDLLIGVFIGMGIELILHLLHGAPLHKMFHGVPEVRHDDDSTVRIEVQNVAVFSNWLQFRRQIVREGLEQGKNVVIDLSNAKLVDHSVMTKLQELARDFHQAGLKLKLEGLDQHVTLSAHPLAARKLGRG